MIAAAEAVVSPLAWPILLSISPAVAKSMQGSTSARPTCSKNSHAMLTYSRSSQHKSTDYIQIIPHLLSVGCCTKNRLYPACKHDVNYH
jgi:hypothetical protein